MKNKLRAELIKQQKKGDIDLIKASSLIIIGKLNDIVENQNFSTIGIYNPFRGEVILENLNLKPSATVALPSLTKLHEPCYRASHSSTNGLATNGPIVIPEIILVPIVGFNSNNYRLGRGGGFYDRLLGAHNITSIGLAFSWQLCNFTSEAHDQKLDLIITESNIYGSLR